MKFTPKRSLQNGPATKKMENAKKGHNKTGRDKVVAPKRRASQICFAKVYSQPSKI